MGRGIVAAILELDTEFHPLIMLCQDPSFVNIAVPNASYHHRRPNLKMLTIFSIFSCGYVSILSSELLIRDQYAVFMISVRSSSVAHILHPIITSTIYSLSNWYHMPFLLSYSDHCCARRSHNGDIKDSRALHRHPSVGLPTAKPVDLRLI